tara:strand:- start:146 stop:541 length:396 start_codon:yes stop_codon:yes gene_type:complete
MDMLCRQKGLSFIGFLLAAVFVVAVGIIAMKVIPVYISHYSITKAMKDLNALPKDELKQSSQQGKAFLREYLSRKLYINEICFISKKEMIIKRKRKVYIVSVPYTVEKKLISNVYLIFKFKPSYEVTIEGN